MEECVICDRPRAKGLLCSVHLEWYQERKKYTQSRVCPFCKGELEWGDHWNGLYDEEGFTCVECGNYFDDVMAQGFEVYKTKGQK